MDYTRKINSHIFVVGLEILDNMPHDRIFINTKGELSTMTYVTVETNEKGEETLNEERKAIEDELCKEFV